MSGLQKLVFLFVGGWVLVLGVIYIVPLGEIALVAVLFSILIGFFLFLLAVIGLFTSRRTVVSVASIFLVLMTTGVEVTRDFEWGARVHFFLLRGRYEAKVSQVLAVPDLAERERVCNHTCAINSNAPRRVYFSYANAFLSKYEIVYDPSGILIGPDIMKEKQIDMFFINARHLSGDWYLVHFGD